MILETQLTHLIGSGKGEVKLNIVRYGCHKIVRINNIDYVISISSYWWSYLFGIFSWFMPIKAYAIKGQIKGSAKYELIKNSIVIVCLGFIIISSSRFYGKLVVVSLYKKVLILIIIFLLLLMIKQFIHLCEDRRMRLTECIVVKVECKDKKTILKCIILNIFLQGLGACLVAIFLFLNNTIDLPLVFLGIWIFFSVGEWTKAPFFWEQVNFIKIGE